MASLEDVVTAVVDALEESVDGSLSEVTQMGDGAVIVYDKKEYEVQVVERE